MKQEQKELLLKDLCARLPYEVKCYIEFNDGKIFHKRILMPIVIQDFKSCEHLKIIKPYLFPLSSMTEEQKKYVTDRWGINENFDFEIDPNWGKYFIELGDVVGFINWCYENHLDINGLIPKGLSIDATGLNIY